MDMEWIEISVEVDGEAAEAVADVMSRYGHQGVVIERAGFTIEYWEYETPPPVDTMVVKAYMLADGSAPDKQQQLKDALRYMNALISIPEPSFKPLQEIDWAEAWKKHYQPLRLGRKIYIRPSWIELDDTRPDDIIIALDPGMAFGTGTHPSTQLCLVAAEDVLEEFPQAQVLDLGCGSGILGIAAAMLGAEHIAAWDIEDGAVKITEENADINDVGALITSRLGGLEEVQATGQQFDVALVNILARVIIDMCDQGLGDLVKQGGVAVFGGIIHDQVEDVEAALQKTGLTPYKRRPSGDWVVVEARKD